MQSLILASGTSVHYAAQGMRSTADGSPPSFAIWAFVALLLIGLGALAYKAKPKRHPAEQERKTRL